MHTAALKRRHWQPPFGLEAVQHGGRNQMAVFQSYVRMVKWGAELRVRWLWPPSLHSGMTRRTRLIRPTSPRIPPGIVLGIITLCALFGPSEAAMVNFQNCLSPNIVSAGPPIPLQWIPLAVSAVFNASAPSHNLNVTVYGNITGQATQGQLPPLNSSRWSNVNETLGKIVDVDPNNHLRSVLRAAFNVLTYTPYRAPLTPFCDGIMNAVCPLAPVFPNGTGYL